MKRTRIKFCGITRDKDAQAGVALGADALGFVLVPASPRNIAADKAAVIRRRLPPFVSAVALFKDADAAFVQDAVDALKPDLLQFHGEEPADFCASFGLPYLKAVAMGEKQSLAAQARRYRDASGLLLDSHARGGMGGRGEAFDWSRVTAVKIPLVLAGGLNPANVGKAVKQLRPHAVDVSSGIESKPGVKDHEMMQAFVEAVRRADKQAK
ncbi:MAG TPA: phosphoribosylanthranilate isomerase [Solimonas sp.]|nr:phosphoribosylanthranilate isomerase [Solimonas sp.]